MHFFPILRRMRACRAGYVPPSNTFGSLIPCCHAIPLTMLHTLFISQRCLSGLNKWKISDCSFTNSTPFCKMSHTKCSRVRSCRSFKDSFRPTIYLCLKTVRGVRIVISNFISGEFSSSTISVYSPP